MVNWWGRQGRRLWRVGLIALLSGLLTLGLGGQGGQLQMGATQLDSLSQMVLPDSNLSPQAPPQVSQIGGAEIAPVYFEGKLLLEVAAPVVIDREHPGENLPVEIRAKRIEDNLNYVVSFTNASFIPAGRGYRTVYDPDSLRVQVSILNDQTVITASDDYRTSLQVLMTVTQQDADYYGVPLADLARGWRDRLQTVLGESLQQRSPQALKAWVLKAVGMLAGLLGLGLGCWVLYRRLTGLHQQLQQQQALLTAASPGDLPPSDLPPDSHLARDMATDPPVDQLAHPPERRFSPVFWWQQRTSLEDRIALVNLGRWLLVWLQVLLWVAVSVDLLNHYPLAQVTAWEVLLKPQVILLLWFGLGLVNRLLNLAIHRFTNFWPMTKFYSSSETQRRQLRLSTAISMVQGLKTGIVYLFGVFITLNMLGFNTNSLLAFGALLGLAVSLAAQNIIKDLVNGFLVLVEDQYAIGDVIEIDSDTSGLVENLNLRLTQLRDGEGRLITLPNSQISRVVNLTRLWARVDESVLVDGCTNIRQAIAVVESVAQSIYDDPQYHPLILEPPKVLGIEAITHAGIEIRTQIKTQPSQQWATAREFRLRLKTALDDHGIRVGRPQREVWHHDADGDSASLR